MTNFENLEKIEEILKNEQYEKLCSDIKEKDYVYVIGNGDYICSWSYGLRYDTINTTKTFHSFESVGFITSNANDYGYDNLFQRWLETIVQEQDYKNSLIIGLSCSGKSENIINALDWGQEKGLASWLINGTESKVYSNGEY